MQVFCGVSFRFLHGIVDYVPVDRPVTFLDGGANVGFASLFFVPLIHFNGKVVAVDASPSTFDLLAFNTIPFSSVVDPVWAAIVSAPLAGPGKKVNFGGKPGDYWGDHLQTGVEDALHSAEVPAISLAQLAVGSPSE
jgi:hypothetical protein